MLISKKYITNLKKKSSKCSHLVVKKIKKSKNLKGSYLGLIGKIWNSAQKNKRYYMFNFNDLIQWLNKGALLGNDRILNFIAYFLEAAYTKKVFLHKSIISFFVRKRPKKRKNLIKFLGLVIGGFYIKEDNDFNFNVYNYIKYLISIKNIRKIWKYRKYVWFKVISF